MRRPSARGVAAAAAAVLSASAALAALRPHPPRLLWNATASAPLGLWRLSAAGAPAVGQWVAARPPARWSAWLAAAGYLPPRVPLLKQVAAVGGQTVCRAGDRVLIDGRLAARARARGRSGAGLPQWRGCRRLAAGEVFLLNARPDSLDGRYLGVTGAADLVAAARPLLTWGRP